MSEPTDPPPDETTIDADPAWLAELARQARATGPAEQPVADVEGTIDASSDVLAQVRAAVDAERGRRAGPPVPPPPPPVPPTPVPPPTAGPPPIAAPRWEPPPRLRGQTVQERPAPPHPGQAGGTGGRVAWWWVVTAAVVAAAAVWFFTRSEGDEAPPSDGPAVTAVSSATDGEG